jgi:hypothetical protein
MACAPTRTEVMELNVQVGESFRARFLDRLHYAGPVVPNLDEDVENTGVTQLRQNVFNDRLPADFSQRFWLVVPVNLVTCRGRRN